MAREVIACQPDDPLRRVGALMEERQIRRLPVVNPDHHLMGIVSVADVARATEAESLPEQVRPRELAHTIAAISRPRGEEQEAVVS